VGLPLHPSPTAPKRSESEKRKAKSDASAAVFFSNLLRDALCVIIGLQTQNKVNNWLEEGYQFFSR